MAHGSRDGPMDPQDVKLKRAFLHQTPVWTGPLRECYALEAQLVRVVPVAESSFVDASEVLSRKHRCGPTKVHQVSFYQLEVSLHSPRTVACHFFEVCYSVAHTRPPQFVHPYQMKNYRGTDLAHTHRDHPAHLDKTFWLPVEDSKRLVVDHTLSGHDVPGTG